MREYEIMLILPAEADDKVIGGVTDRISQVLGTGGGRVTNADRWGRRRLAFPIDKTTEGFYVVAEFEAEPASLKELERVLSLVDDVIRFKIVVRPEHTKGVAKVVPEPPPEEVPQAGPAPETPEPQATAEAAEPEPVVAPAEEPAEDEPTAVEETAVSNTGAQ